LIQQKQQHQHPLIINDDGLTITDSSMCIFLKST
jgi:hypothetical protein